MAYNVKTNSLTKEGGKTKRILLFNNSCKQGDMVVAVNNVFKLMNDVILGDVYSGIVGRVEEDSESASTKPVLVTLFDDTMTITVAVEDTETGEVVEATVQGNVLQEIVEETIEDIEEDKSYAYRFLNYDGTVLQQGRAMKGTAPTYTGSTPTRESSVSTVYTFSGRQPAIAEFDTDTDLVAQYSETARMYWVTFENYDGTTLQSTQVAYGETPSYVGETPTNPAGVFDGWTPEIAPVTGDATYMAVFIVHSYQEAPEVESFELEMALEDDNPNIHPMMIEGIKKVTSRLNVIISTEYLAGGGARDGATQGVVFILTNASSELVAYVFKSRTELGDDYQKYKNVFIEPEEMTDEMWNTIQGFFSTTLTVSTSSGTITISDGSQSILVDASTHAMKYGTDGLWANDTTTEYTTLQTNGWLVDGTYGPYSKDSQENTAWTGVVDSIKNKSEIVCTITVAQESGYILISDGTNGIELKTNPTTLRYHADYYTESSDVSTEYSTITTNGWNVVGTYNYASVDNKKTVFDSLIASLKTKGIANATITHDAVAGEITMQNGQWSFTIMDKNLGATQVYEDGNNLSEANCGKYFQRGNNNGFDWTGTITTSSIQVDTTGYGPGNYYTGTDFIIPNYNWSNPSNGNLRGDTTDTELARQGPAPSGYHVPSAEEWQNFVKMFEVIRPDAHRGIDFKNTFAMPFAGYRASANGDTNNQGYFGFYWTSSPRTTTASYELVFGQTSSSALVSDTYPAYGYSVRCFKNTTPTPTPTFDEVDEALYDCPQIETALDVLNQVILSAPQVIADYVMSHSAQFGNEYSLTSTRGLLYTVIVSGNVYTGIIVSHSTNWGDNKASWDSSTGVWTNPNAQANMNPGFNEENI